MEYTTCIQIAVCEYPPEVGADSRDTATWCAYLVATDTRLAEYIVSLLPASTRSRAL